MSAALIPSPVDCEAILPGFTFADCYGGPAPAGLDAIRAAQLAFATSPGWVSALLRLRNRLGRLVGLRAAPPGGFPTVSATPQITVLGFNDWHLDFRIVITAHPERSAGNEITLTTIVRTHNIAGRTYLFVIMPFHRLIARKTLEQGWGR